MIVGVRMPPEARKAVEASARQSGRQAVAVGGDPPPRRTRREKLGQEVTMGHDKSKYLAWRRRYQPAHIELIIIAESPPDSGKYFYNPEGSRSEVLFREMMKLLNETCSSKDEGLRAFQRAGRILVDATYEPVNDGRKESERNKTILRDYSLLVADLLGLTPDRSVPVVLIKANVCELLEARLKADGFNVLNHGIRPPFPTYQPDKFREDFNRILRSAAVTL
jgi:hypothetical protein